MKTGYLDEGKTLHLTSAMVTGLLMAYVANPIDVIKTRLFNDSTVKPVYDGVVDVLTKTVSNEGITALWKGA